MAGNAPKAFSPCPFCGDDLIGIANMPKTEAAFADTKWLAAYCMSCVAIGPRVNLDPSKDDPLAALAEGVTEISRLWNQRA